MRAHSAHSSVFADTCIIVKATYVVLHTFVRVVTLYFLTNQLRALLCKDSAPVSTDVVRSVTEMQRAVVSFNARQLMLLDGAYNSTADLIMTKKGKVIRNRTAWHSFNVELQAKLEKWHVGGRKVRKGAHSLYVV